jgi:hypothetical protein
MNINDIYVTQRTLRCPEQVPAMVTAIEQGDPLPLVVLSEFEDESIQIEDGHHRCLAYWLSGRRDLGQVEYLLVQRELRNNHKRRFGFVSDLHRRIQQTWHGTQTGKATTDPRCACVPVVRFH